MVGWWVNIRDRVYKQTEDNIAAAAASDDDDDDDDDDVTKLMINNTQHQSIHEIFEVNCHKNLLCLSLTVLFLLFDRDAKTSCPPACVSLSLSPLSSLLHFSLSTRQM